jgi:O-antigen ligase
VPPSLATVLTLGFILALVATDTDIRRSSPALWIPTLWLLITGSRFVSQWLDLGSPAATANVADGSFIDAAYFSTLLLLGTIVLVQRRAQVWAIAKSNRWLMALMVYGFLAIAWSDFPVVSFKRWVKTLGHPVMALILLTDPRPVDAFRVVMKRCAYVLLPLSVLFIKYLPGFGRGFDGWTGAATNNGVGLTKNDLGYLCMIFGLFFLWNLLSSSSASEVRRRWEWAVGAGFIVMALWLLGMANSATSLVALVAGSGMLLLLRFGGIEKRRLGIYVVTAVIAAGIIEALFDPYQYVIRLLGRSPDLTDRKDVWLDALALQPNVLLGAGFEAFWLGDRLQTLWEKWWWRPNQAHNGYIETYLSLGIVGVILLVGVIISAFRTIVSRLRPTFGFDDLRLAFLIAILVFNYAEAAFKGVHFVWTIFFLVVMEAGTRATVAAASPEQRTDTRRHRLSYLHSLANRSSRTRKVQRETTRG